jgi:DNA-binding CsgD family transcriptional regulator
MFPEKFFRDHITFTSTSEIRQILESFPSLKVNEICYDIYFHDGDHFKLVSDPIFIEHYYRNKLFQESFFANNHLMKDGFVISEWVNTQPMNEALKMYGWFPEKILAIIKDQPNKREYFHIDFGINLLETNNLMQYVSCGHHLLDYFKEKAAKLIRKAEKCCIKLPRQEQFTGTGVLQDLISDQVLKQVTKKYCSCSSCAGGSHLTDRELDIVSLLVCGRTIAEITKQLVLSRKTMDIHIAHIKEKLNCKTLLEIGLKLGLLLETHES